MTITSQEELKLAFYNLFMKVNSDYRQYRSRNPKALFSYFFYPPCRWEGMLANPRRPGEGELIDCRNFLLQTWQEAVGIREIVEAAGVDVGTVNAILRFGQDPEKEGLPLVPIEVTLDGIMRQGYTPSGNGEKCIESQRLIAAIRAAMLIKTIRPDQP
ncbi:MAG: hypothetical protein M1275_00745 [Patescibacteria group bacterium]|nr:hypothetical protein [Patescibacteria group bacterium]